MTTCWRTYLFFGEGPGGTFYQALDVSLDDIELSVAPVTGTTTQLLAYFSDPSRVKFRWSFPHYNDFDYTLGTYGDIKSTASNLAKSVGETWSDPAVGQIQNSSGRYALLTGSGFFPASTQANANRGNVVAGTTFYLINIDDGTVFDSEDVGNDNQGESTDNCATASTPDCTKIKNAIQADVVATGPPDSRYISKAYVGDLDGNVWRFDVMMVSGVPNITAKTNLYAAGRAHPLFASMATVNVGATQQYIFFGTGSDLLPSAGIPSSHSYKLLSVLDTGATGTVKYTNTLQSINLTAPDEKVTGFPAVAGDIVFFVTTLTKPNLPCNLPDATLYATTFTGGLGYTAQSGAQGTGAILTVTGARATAPFIVDQHVAFGFGNKVEMLGDQNDYNNGVGQVGVRILSWRDVR
jgi:Tfp pilus tip-associated adhesin PilY1